MTHLNSKHFTWALALAAATTVSTLHAADAPNSDVQNELQSLKARIAELEAKENQSWLNEERTNQIRAIVNDAIADAKTRGQFLDGNLQAGYKNGFFIQDGDNFKLSIGGYAQVRYVFGSQNKKNVSTPVGANDPGDVNGIELRRARVSFTGNFYSPKIFYKLEGDFGGSSSNNADFQVTDAFIGYIFNDQFKVKAGSFKVPFSKVELVSDPYLSFMERPEVNLPFDAVRALGVSLYGDVVKDTLSYEINVNDGSKSNVSGRIDDTSGALDNRLAFYGRVQWAGAGKISDFADESDLRDKNSDFIWMLGGAVGYESQNSTNNGFPAAQTSATLLGLSSANSPGFLGNQNLNGDLYRATVDWSAKWQGWSFNTAGYFQQVNQNPGTFAAAGTQAGTTAGTTVATAGTTTSIPGYGAGDSSFYEAGYYGQVGYFVVPKKLEILARVGQIYTEGYPNRMEVYTVGANYYLFGHGAQISTDVTYIPNEAGYTDTPSDLVRNTEELLYRIQFQVRF